MRVLIVEDDHGIASFLEKGMRAEGHTTAVASGMADARPWLHPDAAAVDLVLLDLRLPDGRGEDLLREVRSGGVRVPVIVLTAKGEVHEKVAGLDAGANDYITKPFAFDELLARIRAVIRATTQPSGAELVVGDLRLDLLTKVAHRSGRRIELAPREWAILELFMRNPHQVLSRPQILSHCWDFSFDPGSNVVDVYVGYLRRKLNATGLPPLIQTIRGAGYRLLPPG